MKLVALDLDGTLLDFGGGIANRTLQEMRRLYGNGVCMAIATGRPYRTTLEILGENGLELSDGFPQMLICDEREAYFLEDGRYRSWTPWNNDAYRFELALLPISQKIVDEMAQEHSSEFLVNNIFAQQTRGFIEVFYGSKAEAESAFPFFVEKLQNTPIKPVRNNRLIAFRWREVGKELILSKVADRFGIPSHRILAVGDSYNDIGMLTRFNAATTENADEEVKAVVRKKGGFVASSSYSLGVAELLADI
ncbi:MAG: HAD family phosphatase [Firmicutes bacterium]|nr:HAD family phosphatase [Bacillota bacterium]